MHRTVVGVVGEMVRSEAQQHAVRGRRPVLGTIVVALLLVGQVLWVGVNAVLGLPRAGWQALAVANVVAFAPPALALLAWLWIRERRSVADLGFRVRRPALAVLAGVVTAAVGFVASQLVVALAEPADAAEDGAGAAFPGPAVALVLLATVAVQSCTEELFLRDYLLGTIRRHGGTAAAVLISSVVFGLLHSLNPNASVAYVAATAALGLLLAFVALSGGGLWASCASHTIWNAIPSIASVGTARTGRGTPAARWRTSPTSSSTSPSPRSRAGPTVDARDAPDRRATTDEDPDPWRGRSAARSDHSRDSDRAPGRGHRRRSPLGAVRCGTPRRSVSRTR